MENYYVLFIGQNNIISEHYINLALIEKEDIIMGDDNTAKIPFSNIVSNLNIEGYSNCEPLANNIRGPVLKCIVKYRNHPSILAIGEVFQRPLFSFSKIQRDEVLSDILKLETSRVSQDTDIPTKIVKENADIFVIVHVSNLNYPIEKSNFPSILKKMQP